AHGDGVDGGAVPREGGTLLRRQHRSQLPRPVCLKGRFVKSADLVKNTDAENRFRSRIIDGRFAAPTGSRDGSRFRRDRSFRGNRRLRIGGNVLQGVIRCLSALIYRQALLETAPPLLQRAAPLLKVPRGGPLGHLLRQRVVESIGAMGSV